VFALFQSIKPQFSFAAVQIVLKRADYYKEERSMKTLRAVTLRAVTFAVIPTLFLSLSAMAAGAVSKTVDAVYKERAQLSGKQVSITGKVVKVNNNVMKRNFLHIQDGTGSSKDGTNDITVTSNQTANVGDTVTVTGTVVLDTDFGFGYKYPLLVTKSSIKVNK
jgi:hypothetical protein